MRSIFLVLFIVLLSSCGKVFKTTVKGRVLNPVTGTGIENARVILQKAGSGIPSGLKTVEAVYTDANGNFEISARKFKSLTASVILDENEYYTIGWKEGGNDYSILSPKKGKITEADYWAVPYGSLNMHIENVNCEGASDIMVFRRKGQFDLDYDSYSTERLGCYVFTSTNGSEIHSGYHYFETKVIRLSGTTYYYDTVFVPENGIGIGEILY